MNRIITTRVNSRTISMLSKDKILEIARSHITSKVKLQLRDARECDLNLYGVDLSNAWCVYWKVNDRIDALQGAEVILIDKTSGEVVYSAPRYLL